MNYACACILSINYNNVVQDLSTTSFNAAHAKPSAPRLATEGKNLLMEAATTSGGSP